MMSTFPFFAAHLVTDSIFRHKCRVQSKETIQCVEIYEEQSIAKADLSARCEDVNMSPILINDPQEMEFIQNHLNGNLIKLFKNTIVIIHLCYLKSILASIKVSSKFDVPSYFRRRLDPR